jgi:hypothetical protein
MGISAMGQKRTSPASFDHFGGAGEQAGRQIETERVRRPNLFPSGLRNAVIHK